MTKGGRISPGRGGQVMVEYLLMSLLLLMLFTGLYRVLQGQLKRTFIQVGGAILSAYH